MKPTSIAALFVISVHLGTAVAAQNLLHHNDGTLEGYSRGPGLGTSQLTVIQRVPEEQWCGRQCLECVTVDLRDLTPATPEPFSIEIRQGIGPANSPIDMPDMSILGLLAAPALAVKPGGPPTFTMTIPLGCVVLPPNKDIYLCVVLPAPGDLLVGYSDNEPYRTICGPPPARYGLGLDLGLSWVFDSVSLALQSTNTWQGGATNWSWAIGASISEDVCQAFASGPAPVGAANYGYVGIYPDLGRISPDAIGFRLRSSHPVGSPCVLILGVSKLAIPFDINTLNSLWSGFLCVDPLLQISGVTGPGGGPCVSESEAVFGPLALPASVCGIDICAQVASLEIIPATIRLSTACLVDL